jgi:ABC-type branched-subunit amino acid transport system substrate-binding protein
VFGREAAAGLCAWADARGIALRVEDDHGDPAESARLVDSLSRRCDLMFGPYGSGCGRAVAEAMAGRDEVVWNHGAAAVPRTGARMVDVLAPAERYWRGLGEVLRAEGARPRVALVRAPGGFGSAIAEGARASLTAAGLDPVLVRDLEAGGPATAAARAREAGADWIVGGGRMEDDLALARATAGAGLRAALVVCGVSAAADAMGDEVLGWIGPAQWDGAPPPPPFSLPAGCDYPAAQALAGALVAERALALAGSSEPGALWSAARALRTNTLVGPFAIDDTGRQTAHVPCVVRWDPGADGPRRVVVWRPSGAGA